MTPANVRTPLASRDLLIPLISSLIITLILFYMDEGYYNFKWMLSWGNWIPFVIYVAIFFAVQLFLNWLIFHRLLGWNNGFALSMLSLVAGLIFLLWFM